jgi:hypothetical protein
MGIMAGSSTRYACIMPWLLLIAIMLLSWVFIVFPSVSSDRDVLWYLILDVGAFW